MMSGGLGSILGGIFGASNDPYKAGMDQYKKYAQQGINVQQPFYNAGQQGMGNYQNWLQQMQNPSQFINNTMNQYQQSPWAQNEQQQAMNMGNNYASANGLSGSTPMAQQMQQNASNISSQDMQNWLGNVLGINSQYGQGQQNLMGVGQNAANQISGMYGNMANAMGSGAYGSAANQNNSWGNILGGLGGLVGSMFMPGLF